MKKGLCILLTSLLLFLMPGCANDAQDPVAPATSPTTAAKKAGGIDVDLTVLSSTMIYAEVYNMMVTPGDYVGKTVRMRGQFAAYHDEWTGNDYYACVIADATACCQQGLEFILKEGNYPQEGADVTVTGEFQTYFEGEEMYCHLIDARLEA